MELSIALYSCQEAHVGLRYTALEVPRLLLTAAHGLCVKAHLESLCTWPVAASLKLASNLSAGEKQGP